MQKIIVLKRVEGGYGGMDCLAIMGLYRADKRRPTGRGADFIFSVLIDGELAGTMERCFGNNGEGKPSEDVFTPSEGWDVEYMVI